MKETKKMIITIILLLSIICVTIGVSFAAFSFISHGTVENTIETGTVALTYTEGKTGIILEDALPISDETGKMLTGENNVFDFTVTATLGKDTVITYEVTAVKIPITDMEPLLDNEVRLYLERAVDPEIEYTEIMAPTNFIPKGEVSEIGSPIGSMILDTGTFSNEGITIHNYRLRMWVDENTEITDVQKKYGIKINVYAKQGVFVNEPTESSCFVFDETTGTITNYKDIDANGNECPKDVVIPRQIGGVDVVNIGTVPFDSEELSMSRGVTRGLDPIIAFREKGLTSVIIPDGVKRIRIMAFRDNQLTSVRIPDSVTTIGDDAFAFNKLTSLTIGNNVQTIGAYAFNENQLTSVTIPDSVTTIGNYAFQLNQLISMTIGNNITTIGDYAFYKNQLTSLTLGNSITTIGDSAFAHNNLISVTVPSCVTSIGKDAFYKRSYSNNNLTKIINQTGREFDWMSITGGSSAATFVTGTIAHSVGDIIVTDTE